MTNPESSDGDEMLQRHDALVKAILALLDQQSIDPAEAAASLLECLSIVTVVSCQGNEAAIFQLKAMNESTFDDFVALALDHWRSQSPMLCRTCAAWSELVARSIGGAPVEALCLKPDSPNHGVYMTGDETCAAHTRDPEFADAPSERAPTVDRRQ